MSTALIASVLGALAGALFGTVGSWYVLLRLSPRQQRLAELRQDMYEILDLATEYWNANARSVLNEARILARQQTLSIKFHELAGTSRLLSRAYQTTSHDRRRLWKVVTGGTFQQTIWQADPGRARDAGVAVAKIVAQLPS